MIALSALLLALPALCLSAAQVAPVQLSVKPAAAAVARTPAELEALRLPVSAEAALGEFLPAAADLARESPVVAIAVGDQMEVVPQSLAAGAKAVTSRGVLTVTQDMADTVARSLAAGDVASAFGALRGWFDGTNVASEVPLENQGIDPKAAPARVDSLELTPAKVYDYNRGAGSFAVNGLSRVGDTLYTVTGGGGEVVSIDAATGAMIRRAKLPIQRVYPDTASGVHANGQRVYVANGWTGVVVYDALRLKEVRRIALPEGVRADGVVARGNDLFVSVTNLQPEGMAGIVRVDAATGRIAATYPVRLRDVGTRVSPTGGIALDGDRALLGYGGSVLALDLKTGRYSQALKRIPVVAPNGLPLAVPESVRAILVTDDRLIVADEFHGLEIFDKKTGVMLTHVQAKIGKDSFNHDVRLWATGLAADGRRVYVGNGAGGLAVLDLP